MIEDKDVKIAVDPIEAEWENIRRSSETKIRQMKIAIELEEMVLKLAESRVKKS